MPTFKLKTFDEFAYEKLLILLIYYSTFKVRFVAKEN